MYDAATVFASAASSAGWEEHPYPVEKSGSLSSLSPQPTNNLNAIAMTASGTDHVAIHTNVPTGPNGQPYTVEYLSQLLKDKKQLAAFPNVFHHLERLADEEISKVRVALFQFEFAKDEVTLPDAEGDIQVHTEKVFVPTKEFPDFNFVGRILGPRGMTAKQLEQQTGCKIMVRGRGSMRDKKKEELNRGKPNWEHLSEELHVLIQCEDTTNRARVKLARAVDEVRKLLVPAPEGEDELKRKQLMELAIINGTYRSASEQAAAAAVQLAAKQQPLAAAFQAAALAQAQARGLPLLAGAPAIARSPTLAVAGAPIVMSPGRGQNAVSSASANNAAVLQLQNAAAAAQNNAVAAQQAALLQQQQQAVEYQQLLLSQGLSYEALTGAAMQYQPQYQALLQQQYADYAGVDLSGQTAPGAMINQRRVLGSSRDHPYKQ